MSEEINKNFKGLYDTSKTTFITDRTGPTHFYEPEVKTPRIKNVSYSINFDKKELYKQIEDLQQKVEQLEKELNQEKEEYAGLHKVLNNKEEEFEKENYNNVVEISRLKRKVEQLENIRKEAIEYINKMWLAKLTPDTVSNTKFDLLNILNKGDKNE